MILYLLMISYVESRNVYWGIFRENDFLVAQDHVYKERRPYGIQTAVYGRAFPCEISYLRVEDRLKSARAPKVHMIRGGPTKPFVTLRIYSEYNSPIYVDVYVGCENKPDGSTDKPKPKPTNKPPDKPDKPSDKPDDDAKPSDNTDKPPDDDAKATDKPPNDDTKPPDDNTMPPVNNTNPADDDVKPSANTDTSPDVNTESTNSENTITTTSSN